MKRKPGSNQRQRTTLRLPAACPHRLRCLSYDVGPMDFLHPLGDKSRQPVLRVVMVNQVTNARTWWPSEPKFGRAGCQPQRPATAGSWRPTSRVHPDRPPRLARHDPPHAGVKLPRRDSEDDYIVIPPPARAWELAVFPFSTRVKNILASRECRRLGDLHGVRYSRILRWRSVGGTTLKTLMAFIKSVQQGDWGLESKPNLTGWPSAWKL